MDKALRKMNGSEVLVTGGAGFIGSNLVEKLVRNGMKVTVLDLFLEPYGGNKFNLEKIITKINLIKGDVRSKKTVEKLVKGKDFIFHLAGQTGRTISFSDPFLDLSINSVGTLNILESVKRNKNRTKVIFSSSRGVIGKPIYFPVDENHPTNPRDIYGIHKLAAEKYCLTYKQEFGTKSTILRLNNVYGPKCQVRSNHYGTINLFIKYALLKETLPIYGNGKQTRDYVYIDDVISALILATDTKADGEIFFVGSGRENSLLEIAKTIKKHIKNSEHKLVPYPESLVNMDFDRFYSSSKKITKHLNWKSTVSLEEGIKKTINYYKKHLPHYI